MANILRGVGKITNSDGQTFEWELTNPTKGQGLIYQGGKWINGDFPGRFSATGGIETEFTDSSGITWKIHAFTGDGIFRPEGSGNIDVMIVGGGGAGGRDNAGGGGAGGLLWLQDLEVTNQDYTITIGDGGAPGQNGFPSSAFGQTALGGGLGGSGSSGQYNGSSGGCGGGGASEGTHGTGGTGSQGKNGGRGYNYAGGGGGGAGSEGQDGNLRGTKLGGKGGAGENMSSYFGTTYGDGGWFAGGGAGGNENLYNTMAPGGQGGGADAPYNSPTSQHIGQPNTGGGGGGGTYNGTNIFATAGGSGIVLIRYK